MNDKSNENTVKSNQVVLSHINALSPSQLVEDPKIANKFIELYNNVHGAKSGGLFYAKEKFNFMRLISENPKLQKCTKLSLYGTFLDVAVNGLSFEQGNKPLAYITTRSINVGTKDDPSYEERAYLTVSPYGELLMRMRAGQIKYADNPVIVYQGDKFVPHIDEKGNKSVTYSAVVPRTSKTIIGAFIKITRVDGTFDFQWLLQDDIERLKKYSDRNNRGTGDGSKANKLYSSNSGQIDTGFLEAKMIKHAFDSYVKVRTGKFTELETEKIQEAEKEIDYGIPVENLNETVPGTFAAVENKQPEASIVHDDEAY